MGYDLHIECAKRTTRAEWQKIVDGDPEFAGSLSFRDGRISIKNPTDDEIAQLTQLARKLKGRVVGDDGEEYAFRPSKKLRRTPKKQSSSDLIAKAKQKADALPRRAGRPRTFFSLTLYKRNGFHYVSASIPAEAWIQTLADVMIPTTTAIEDIAAALTQATEIAHAALTRPKAQRFLDGTPHWELAGAATWNQFCVGVSGAAIAFEPERTRITHTFRDPDHPGSLTSDGKVVELRRNASDVELAQAALKLLVEREKQPDTR